MKKPRTTARSIAECALALAKASKALGRAARLYEEDTRDLYARVLTPGGTRVDRDTRLAKIEQRLGALLVHFPEDPSLREILSEIRTIRSEERE